MTPFRRQELSELADVVTDTYFREGETILPEHIALQSGITFSYGNYADAFDGLLEHRSGDFHIYINLDRLKSKHEPRTRFTFAHELGHYYIDEHRNALRKGKTPSHPSFNKLMMVNPVEREADYFASCLLMPEMHMRNLCRTRPLSVQLLDNISVRFKTSISSVIFRYFQLDLFPMCLIMTVGGKIEWTMRSKDFWNGDLPRKGVSVLKSSVAGEYFDQRTRYDFEQIVYGDDWFSGPRVNKDQQFYEKCYYLSTNKVLSLVWKKEGR